MKKIVSIILLIAILVSLCACGKSKEPTVTKATLADLDPSSPEAMYGHIDQTVPQDGVYKIWNSDGVKWMLQNPTGNYELLCNVDMNGAELAPMDEFSGELNGANFVIKNFTLKGDGESFGFVTVNKGNIHNLLLEQVTFVPGASAKYIGSLAGTNAGVILRCTVTGTLPVESAAADAYCGGVVGVNTGSVANIEATVDVTYTAQGGAAVGGVAGSVEGGKTEYVDQFGVLTVTGSNKTTGLIAGTAKDTSITGCAFVGADNSLDGKLFTNFAGAEENVTITDCLWRDNHKPALTEGQQALRDRVEERMYEMGSVKWTVKQDLNHSCYCSLSGCYGSYGAVWTYYGLPYNHKTGSLARMQYCQNEDGSLKDWVYEAGDFDGYDLYMGSDCCGSLSQAWWSVSNSMQVAMTMEHLPFFNHGAIAVGYWDWEKKPEGTHETQVYFQDIDMQKMYESYALMRKGDAINSRVEIGPHVRMAADDAVVVRTQDGLIDPQYSYCLFNEQGGGGHTDENLMTTSTWRLHYKYTFANLAFDMYVPYTIEELLTGEMEPVECTILDGADGYAGMFSGMVKANYRLDYVVLNIQDDKGNTVLDHTLFVTPEKYTDESTNVGNQKTYVDEFYMSNFAITLTDIPFELGQTYHYTVTAKLYTGDSIVVNESSFVYGQA